MSTTITVVDRQFPNGSGFPAATVQTARRTFLQFLRTPQILFMGAVQGALFLLIFRYIFGGAIDAGSTNYVDFLVPGFLATNLLWLGMAPTVGVAEDASSGVHDRFRSLPMPRAAAVTGRAIGDTVLIAWGQMVTIMVAFAIGFRVQGGVAGFVAVCALLLVGAAAFSWVFIWLGMIAGNAQAAQGISLLVVPLAFVSSGFVPADTLPGWMQPFAEHQPVSVLSNAMRSLMLGGTDGLGIGHTTSYRIGLSLAWCAGIAILFATLAIARFGRRR